MVSSGNADCLANKMKIDCNFVFVFGENFSTSVQPTVVGTASAAKFS